MRPTVVITGAGTGIGRALAVAWGRRGARVILTARSSKALAEAASEVEQAGGAAVPVAGDVTDEAHRAEVAGAAGAVHTLVHNAGRGYYAPMMKVDIDELRALFELNVLAPLRLTQLIAPSMPRGATVVMLSSISGVLAAPGYGAYAASKFALEAMAMTMRAELAPRGIAILVVRPGPVATGFRANAARAPGAVGYDRPARGAQSAEAVAVLTLRAVDQRRAVVETSAAVRTASLVTRVAPPLARAVLALWAKVGPSSADPGRKKAY